MSRYIVLKITGHLFDIPLQIDKLQNIIRVIKRHISKKLKMCIVVGGGELARKYISEINKMGGTINEYYLDLIGILSTQINAAIFKIIYGPKSYLLLNKDLQEIPLILNQYDICVVGGVYPGFSTNAVSALISEYLNAEYLITMSKAGGIYSKDPAKYLDAKLLKEIQIDKLMKILSGYEKAGLYPLFDKVSLNIIKRSKIKVMVIPPTANSLEKALKGENPGSIIIV